MELPLFDKVAVVTGGNKGIGYEVCSQLLALGAQVVLTARNRVRGLSALQMLCEHSDRIHFFELDVLSPTDPLELATYIKERFGRLDILINNAGIALDKFVPAVELELDVLEETMATNVYGAFRVTKALIPLMKLNGGRIINVSSQLGSLTVMTSSTMAYRMSKTALNTMTKVLANELQDFGVLVNSVCPGWVRTELGGDDAPLTSEEGARGIVSLALLADDGPTGSFYRHGEVHPW